MCGICGVLTAGPTEPHETFVRSINAMQMCRGPDHEAVEHVRGQRLNAAYGHTRLSIIDLSASANQPFWDHERRVVISYNGEIYNYLELRDELQRSGSTFVTRSDTEVIVEAFKRWGSAAFDRLNGMFAFALHDIGSQTAFLVRDRFGVKPIYYHVDADGTLSYASTPGPLARAYGLRRDPAYAARGLVYGIYDGDDIAPYIGLRAVRPSSYLEVSGASGAVTHTERAYYNLEARVRETADGLAGRSERDLTDVVLATVRDAVDIRFRADVPVAISLSGGLDSSTIAALSRERGSDHLKAFTFGDPSDHRTEGPRVAELAAHNDIEIHFVRRDVSEISASIDTVLTAQGGPFPSASIIAQYLVFEDVRRAGIRVLLGGQGGDEVFMGYKKFRAFRLAELVRARRIGPAASFLFSLAPAVAAELPRWREHLAARRRYIGGMSSGVVAGLPAVELDMAIGDEPLWERQVRDIFLTSLPSLLRYEDRNSMGNSVESRLPFLDYRVIELALALPVEMKLRRGYGKWVIREAMRERLPVEILKEHAKRGFDVPQADWIGRGLGEALREPLRTSEARSWLQPGTDPDVAFSDDELRTRRSAFAEAITVRWLAGLTPD